MPSRLHRASTRPSAPPSRREQQAFGQHLPRQPPAAGADGRAHRQLALPAHGARQQQVGDVDAGHQQDDAHRGHQHDERMPHVADDVLVQGDHGEGEAAVGRVELGEARREAAR